MNLNNLIYILNLGLCQTLELLDNHNKFLAQVKLNLSIGALVFVAKHLSVLMSALTTLAESQYISST